MEDYIVNWIGRTIIEAQTEEEAINIVKNNLDIIARNSFFEGEVVLVRLDPKIAETAIDGQYQVIDYLPSGLRPITQIYRNGLKRGSGCDPIWYPSAYRVRL